MNKILCLVVIEVAFAGHVLYYRGLISLYYHKRAPILSISIEDIVNDVDIALRYNPYNPEARRTRSTIYVKKGDIYDAYEQSRLELVQFKSVSGWKQFGSILFRINNLEMAKDNFAKALNCIPNDEGTLEQLALLTAAIKNVKGYSGK